MFVASAPEAQKQEETSDMLMTFDITLQPRLMENFYVHEVHNLLNKEVINCKNARGIIYLSVLSRLCFYSPKQRTIKTL